MSKTILIAEDEPTLLNLLAKKLKALGFNVIKAGDGEDAIAKIKSQPVDLMLLDIIMPRKNGLQVLQELRVNMNNKTPVIILSNLEKGEDIQAGKSYGVYDYLIKSHISMRKLSNQVTKALGRTA